jgi:hypothetical protein
MKKVMILSLLLAFSLVVSAGAVFAAPARAPGKPHDGVDFGPLSKAGSGIYFGSYPLASRHVLPVGYGGTEYYNEHSKWIYSKGQKNPVLWRVMGEENGKIVLMSEYIIDFYYFNSSDKIGKGEADSWESSDIRKWLNSEDHADGFLSPSGYGKTFTDTEFSEGVAISDVNTSKYVSNDNSLSRDVTKATRDYFYLLWGTYSFPYSFPQGFIYPDIDSANRSTNKVSWYADDVMNQSGNLGDNNAKVATLKNHPNEKVEYWLRSPSPVNPNRALFVDGTMLKYYEESALDRTYDINTNYLPDESDKLYPDNPNTTPPSGSVVDLSVDVLGARLVAQPYLGGNPPHPYPGVRPVFKFDPKPESVIFISKIGGTGQGDTPANSGYEERKDNEDNYKLTLLNENLSAGTVTVDGEGWVQSMDVPVQPDSWVTVRAEGASDGTNLMYKLVDTSGKIVAYGNGEKTSIPIYTINFSTGNYAAYVWAQSNEPINSHEGSRPLYFNLAVSSNDAVAGSLPAADLESSEGGMIGNIKPDALNRAIDAAANEGKMLDLRVPVSSDATKVGVRFPVGHLHRLEKGLKISTPQAGNIMLNRAALGVLIDKSLNGEDSIIEVVIARSSSADVEGLNWHGGSVSPDQVKTLEKYSENESLRGVYNVRISVDDIQIEDFNVYPSTIINPSELTIELPYTPSEEGDGEEEEIKVYRVEANGDVSDIPSVIEEDKVVIKVDHLSIYALVGEPKPGGGGGGGGGGGCAAGFGVFALIAAAGGVYLRRKR